jgi:hypothetical protein
MKDKPRAPRTLTLAELRRAGRPATPEVEERIARRVAPLAATARRAWAREAQATAFVLAERRRAVTPRGRGRPRAAVTRSKIEAYMSAHPRASRRTVARALGISPATLRERLNRPRAR